MEFSNQGLPFPSPGDHPDPGIEPGSPALQSLYHLSHQGSPLVDWYYHKKVLNYYILNFAHIKCEIWFPLLLYVCKQFSHFLHLGSQSLKYLLSDSLQKKPADLWFRSSGSIILPLKVIESFLTISLTSSSPFHVC